MGNWILDKFSCILYKFFTNLSFFFELLLLGEISYCLEKLDGRKILRTNTLHRLLAFQFQSGSFVFHSQWHFSRGLGWVVRSTLLSTPHPEAFKWELFVPKLPQFAVPEPLSESRNCGTFVDYFMVLNTDQDKQIYVFQPTNLNKCARSYPPKDCNNQLRRT